MQNAKKNHHSAQIFAQDPETFSCKRARETVLVSIQLTREIKSLEAHSQHQVCGLKV
jgi:hypothetical protein